jgi:hypothetical protein
MEENKTQRRDRDGEIFENDLTEEDTAPGGLRDTADHTLDMEGDQIDSQEGDEFMHERKFPHGDKTS